MLKGRYDVIVVGGGLAGLACALELARSGFKVLLLEKKGEIGIPVRCGELTQPNFYEVVGLSKPSQVVENDFGSMVLISRSRFEMELARMVIQEGGEVYTRAWVRGYIPFSRNRVGVRVQMGGREEKVMARAVVACDGVEATLPRMAGLASHLEPSELGSCYSARLEGVKVDPSRFDMGYNLTGLYFYWIFPISNHAANVGIGVLGTYGNRARRIFLEFVKGRPELSQGSIVREIVGVVPITRPLERPYGDGILVAGTAARLVNADGGEGVIYALLSGVEAARTLRVARDYSASSLAGYRRRLDWVYKRLNYQYEILRLRLPPGFLKKR